MNTDRPIEVRPGKGYWRSRLGVVVLAVAIVEFFRPHDANYATAITLLLVSVALSVSAIFARLSVK